LTGAEDNISAVKVESMWGSYIKGVEHELNRVMTQHGKWVALSSGDSRFQTSIGFMHGSYSVYEKND
jgi:hypothetical protein